MTFYEVIIKRGDPVDSLVIDGMSELVAAIRFLDEAARRGDLGGVESVSLYDEVSVPGALLGGMLEHLGQPNEWVDHRLNYDVYLSEV